MTIDNSGTTASAPGQATHISYDDLVAAIEAKLLADGASAEAARIMAHNHAGCERDGTLSHGVFRVPQYAEALALGYLNASAEPSVQKVGPTFLRIDGDAGFAQVALAKARETILDTVREHGVALVSLHNAHHNSALWPDIEDFALQGLVALTAVMGGSATVAPRGVKNRVFGTNPIGFATPVAGGPPLVADFATSALSFGDTALAAREGRPVPLGTGVDDGGNDTTDANAIIRGGSLLPFGEHKGAILALIVEVLTAALTGSEYAHELLANKPREAKTTPSGQFLLVIDPDRGREPSHAPRVASLINMLRDEGMDRMPADHRYARRALAEKEGVPITPGIRKLLD